MYFINTLFIIVLHEYTFLDVDTHTISGSNTGGRIVFVKGARGRIVQICKRGNKDTNERILLVYYSTQKNIEWYADKFIQSWIVACIHCAFQLVRSKVRWDKTFVILTVLIRFCFILYHLFNCFFRYLCIQTTFPIWILLISSSVKTLFNLRMNQFQPLLHSYQNLPIRTLAAIL